MSDNVAEAMVSLEEHITKLANEILELAIKRLSDSTSIPVKDLEQGSVAGSDPIAMRRRLDDTIASVYRELYNGLVLGILLKKMAESQENTVDFPNNLDQRGTKN